MQNYVFIAVLVVFVRRGRGEIVQRWAFVNTVENAKVDNGDLIKRQRSQSLMSCTQQCLSERLCASFDYDSSSTRAGSRGFCELYKDGEELKLIQEPGWLCGHLHDKRKIVKPPAECKTWRTKDGGCCVFPFLYQGKLRDLCVFDGELWCSVTKNYDIDNLRGACEDFNFTLTTLGTQGPTGPTNTSGYQGTTLQYKVSLDKGIQIWKVPLNGSYVIEAWGASGAEGRNTVDPSSSTISGGKGAYMKGSFNLTHGMLLKILVGQRGSVGNVGTPLPGGGGWGTFVILSSDDPLIVAGGGGGGGAPKVGYDVGDPGQITERGSQYGGSNGEGGTITEEGSSSVLFQAGAGGGLTGDGESAIIVEGGKSFENGGKGGKSPIKAFGGFGGGGGGSKYPGAGGGYSGGGVFKKKGGKTIAGGGGSLNSGINPVKKMGVNGGDGKVVITLVEPEF